jgi:hypothetical protein
VAETGITPDLIGSNDDPDKHRADAALAYKKAEMSILKAKEAARQVAGVQNPTPPSGTMRPGQALLTGGIAALLNSLSGGGQYTQGAGAPFVNGAMQAFQANQERNFNQAAIEAQRQRALGGADVNAENQNAALQQNIGNQNMLSERQFGVQNLKNQGMVTKQQIASMSADERNLHTVAGREFVAQLAQEGTEARAIIGQLGNVNPEARFP